MLLSRLSCPANDEPDACGVRRVKSVIVRPIVGKAMIASLGIAVDAPVTVLLNAPPVAVTSCALSVSATWRSSKRRSVVVPSVTWISVCTLRS